jgi:succinyl-CoA synthetase beta subunit
VISRKKRNSPIKLYEYQAQQLFAEYGIPVPAGHVANNPKEAAEASTKLGGTAVVKGQVLTGGRGKAGAVKVVDSPEQAEKAAAKILQLKVKDIPVEKVLVSQKMDIRDEYYAAITVDRDSKSIVLIFSDAGGVDIEETAAKTPEKIRQLILTGAGSVNTQGMLDWFSESIKDTVVLPQAVSICEKMFRLFREKDCSLIEINPLAVIATGEMIALDAKLVIDDNALIRHPKLEEFRNPEEYTAEERRARKAGLSFVSLDGEIGCMVNGAGLAMATMDCIKLAGGNPANFLDVGGSSSPQKAIEALSILQQNKAVKAILVNIFGGITRCDDVAEGILTAREKLSLQIPLVIRLIGTNEKKGRAMLQEVGIHAFSDMNKAITTVVELAKKGGPA